jgi:hypothetical protein
MTQDATPAVPTLTFHGCPIIVDLSYRLFFIGTNWSSPYLMQQADRLDTALRAALQDTALNTVFDSYLAPAQTGPVTAAPAGERGIVSIDWQSCLSRDDLHKIAQTLLNEGRLPRTGLDDYALALILPPGTVLLDPRDAVQTSTKGLASIHGTFHLTDHGAPMAVHFCAAVWSDGSNGVAVPAFQDHPAWLPWENTCAALYHEMAELRTNRNIDEAPESGGEPPPGRLGWTVHYGGKWIEPPDLPILWAGELPQKVFCKGTVGGVDGVPIQVMWAKDASEPHMPSALVPQMHRAFRYRAV